MRAAIDTEKLRELIEERTGELIMEMDPEDMKEARNHLIKICFEQEGGTPVKECLREAISWINEKIMIAI